MHPFWLLRIFIGYPQQNEKFKPPRHCAQVPCFGQWFEGAVILSTRRLFRKTRLDRLERVVDLPASERGEGFLREGVAPLLDPSNSLVTCLYRGVAAGGSWSRLEALGMSVEMPSGVLVANMIQGMRSTACSTLTRVEPFSRNCPKAPGTLP